MPRTIVFATVAMSALSLLIATPSMAASVILGAGLATDCSKAAIAGRSDVGSIEVCTEALETQALGPRDRAGTFVNRGILKMRRKDFDSARTDFGRAVRLYPDLGEAYVNRGASLIAQKRYADGLVDIDRGMEMGVDEPAKVWFNRGIAYEGLDQATKAYKAYQEAARLAPEWTAPQKELTRFTVTSRTE